MATRLNITVAAETLVKRNKQQQNNARLDHQTQKALKLLTEPAVTETQRNQQIANLPAVGAPTLYDTYTEPYIRTNRPAATRLLGNAFLLITNSPANESANNIDIFNIYNVFISDGSSKVGLTGDLDYTVMDFFSTTYVFMPGLKTVDVYKKSVPFPSIDAMIFEQYTPVGENYPGTIVYKPSYSLRTFRPQLDKAYTIELQCKFDTTQSLNSGAIVAGYLNSPYYFIGEWFSSDSLVQIPDVLWGRTNKELLYLYPDDYVPE